MRDLFCPSCGIGIDYNQMKARKCNNCLHDWEVYHVMPVNDTKPHSESHTCGCDPAVENEGENMVCVHNSYDGREGVEVVNEILK